VAEGDGVSALESVARSSLRTRPPFSDLFGINPTVQKAVAASMRERGFDPAEPVVVWREAGVVIDGHTRLAAATAAGVAEVVASFQSFPDEWSALAYAVHRQRDRRNLSRQEIARVITELDRLKPRGGDHGNQHTAPKAEEAIAPWGAIASNGKSALATAAIVGVSARTVERVRAISTDDEAKAALDNGASFKAAAKVATDNKRAADERAAVAPAMHAPAVLLLTPIEEALRLAKTPGAFTVPEWLALDDRTRQQLIEEAPALGSAKFNRTTERVDWAWHTWNPVTGCLHNCEYCYARDIAQRFYPQGFVPTFIPARLHAPRHTKVPAKAETDYREANVFACSMADLFGKWVPQEWIDAVFTEVRHSPEWRFLCLTKFPRRLAELEWPDNAWCGTTVDKQFRVDVAEQAFANVTAGVKWLSCEPMLERLTFASLDMFDWVVIGAESPNSNNRAGFQPPWEWVEHLIRQARDAGCRVYLKENLRNRPMELPAILDRLPEVP